MREVGIVISLKGNLARVQMPRSAHCAGCRVCSSFGEGARMELEARNDLSAKVGDLVEVEINPQQVVGHSLLIFFLPVINLILGYFVGVQWHPLTGISAEGTGILTGLGFLILTFLGIYLYDKICSRSGKVCAWIVGRKGNLTSNNFR